MALTHHYRPHLLLERIRKSTGQARHITASVDMVSVDLEVIMKAASVDREAIVKVVRARVDIAVVPVVTAKAGIIVAQAVTAKGIKVAVRAKAGIIVVQAAAIARAAIRASQAPMASAHVLPMTTARDVVPDPSDQDRVVPCPIALPEASLDAPQRQSLSPNAKRFHHHSPLSLRPNRWRRLSSAI
ncbi:hypothetical protein KSB_28280 [Ktedonobacter robiniae]|uniref:Uncharacterized protein n=1 Tax=Ktedonobacter robiniae TaxID=2778365 RepID=A0ABQ3UNS6_9CHLR|nr:hypothetical protein KSB_28280 [Ktedonobacter robiniae]